MKALYSIMIILASAAALVFVVACVAVTLVSWFDCNGNSYPPDCPVTLTGTVANEFRFMLKMARNIW